MTPWAGSKHLGRGGGRGARADTLSRSFSPAPSPGLTVWAWPKGMFGTALAAQMQPKTQFRSCTPRSTPSLLPAPCHTSAHVLFLTVPSSWGLWAPWSVCSAPCDGGIQRRGRSCSGSTPGDPECPGPHSQTRDCNTQPCTGASLPPPLPFSTQPHSACPWGYGPLFILPTHIAALWLQGRPYPELRGFRTLCVSLLWLLHPGDQVRVVAQGSGSFPRPRSPSQACG